MGKPLVVVALVLLGLGLVSADPAKGRTGADGFHCRGWTDDAAWNRTICRYHPARIWTMPVSDLLPDGVRLEDPATWF
jgi:hypothetical protein